MKKRIYRATPVKDLDLDALSARLPQEAITVGVDVAKEVMFAALLSSEAKVLGLFSWVHLSETRRVVSWLSSLSVQVALEPSGSYGDALRYCLYEAGVPVYRVHPKHTKDSRELFDGVPSSHDAKCASMVAWLHLVGRSQPWKPSSPTQRTLAAMTQRLGLHEGALTQSLNRLEARLARYWPEVLGLLKLDSATLLELLSKYGSPAAMASDASPARWLMVHVGGPFLSEEKIDQVLSSAAQTLGVGMVAAERGMLQELAQETRRRQQMVHAAKQRVRALCGEDERLSHLGEQVGELTAAVLVSRLGALEEYPNSGSLFKASGLNLKEISSGRRQGQLGISKRGPRQVRKYLYLAVLRWIQEDPWAQAWYKSKVQRQGGLLKRKAIVALMRKLLSGLRWVALGHEFDSTKLFDTRRLAPLITHN